MLATLVLESLGDRIRNNPNITGVTIQGKEIKGAQYADDIWLVLLYNRESLDEVNREFKYFKIFAGLKVNPQKTVILPIRNLVNTRSMLNTPFRWSNEAIMVLGIQIHSDLHLMKELNYSPLLQRMRDVITMWKYRKLTPLGRVQIINSLVSTLVMFKFSCLPSPDETFFLQYEDIVKEFIWKGKKKSKICKAKLIQDYTCGRLRLIDLKAKDLALKAAWVEKAIQNPNSPVYYYLPIQNKEIWSCNITSREVHRLCQNTSFQAQVWSIWAKINHLTPQNVSDVLDQTLWYNHFIKHHYIHWYVLEAFNNGLTKIGVIYDMRNNTFLMYEELVKYGNCMNFKTYHVLVHSIPVW